MYILGRKSRLSIFLAMYTHAFPPGQTLRNGAYEIIKVLGQGGFGITYLARFTSLDRLVAIKEFFISGYSVRSTSGPDIALQAMKEEDFSAYKQKFIAEARTLARFSHPGIVPITDVFEENETAYFVMQYIEGASLADMIRQMGPIPEGDASAYIQQAAEALQVVHSQKMLHRDIKPDNIMIRPDGQVVLIDFGTARAFLDSKTVTHTTLLTPGYAPLEQYSDRQQRGTYTDIYALGATLYACLTGQAPPPAVDRIQQKELSKLPSGPIRGVVEKAMAMEPAHRHQDVQRFLADLRQETDATSIHPSSVPDIQPLSPVTEVLSSPDIPEVNPPVGKNESPVSGTSSSAPRKFPLRIILGVLAVVLTAIVGFAIWNQQQELVRMQYDSLISEAQAALAAGDFEKAREVFRSARKKLDDPAARNGLARVDSTEQALAVQETQTRMRKFKQLRGQGNLDYALKNYDRAKTSYTAAREFAPADSIRALDTLIADCEVKIAEINSADYKLKAIYLGAHPLTLQWISWDFPGKVRFYEENGILKLEGEQLSRGSDQNYLKISGTVELISDKEFQFTGEVGMRIDHINGGKACMREGTLNFKATGNRKYWRMREMRSPCDITTDYVDIYFRKLDD